MRLPGCAAILLSREHEAQKAIKEYVEQRCLKSGGKDSASLQVGTEIIKKTRDGCNPEGDAYAWEYKLREIEARENGTFLAAFEIAEAGETTRYHALQKQDALHAAFARSISRREKFVDYSKHMSEEAEHVEYNLIAHYGQFGNVYPVRARRFDFYKLGVSFYTYVVDHCFVVEFYDQLAKLSKTTRNGSRHIRTQFLSRGNERCDLLQDNPLTNSLSSIGR